MIAQLTQIRPFLKRRGQRSSQGLDGVVYPPYGLVQVSPVRKVTPGEDTVCQVGPEGATIDDNTHVHVRRIKKTCGQQQKLETTQVITTQYHDRVTRSQSSDCKDARGIGVQYLYSWHGSLLTNTPETHTPRIPQDDVRTSLEGPKGVPQVAFHSLHVGHGAAGPKLGPGGGGGWGRRYKFELSYIPAQSKRDRTVQNREQCGKQATAMHNGCVYLRRVFKIKITNSI